MLRKKGKKNNNPKQTNKQTKASNNELNVGFLSKGIRIKREFEIN